MDASHLTVEDEKSLQKLFTRHTPTIQQQLAMELIDAAAQNFARQILAAVPRSADRTHALRLVRSAKMWANTAIMYGGASLG